QEQVEGIAEDDLRAQFLDLPRQHALDRAVGADRHERRRLDGAARERDAAAAGGAVGAEQLELHATHRLSPLPLLHGHLDSSFRRKPESGSSGFLSGWKGWIPAFAGMTVEGLMPHLPPATAASHPRS